MAFTKRTFLGKGKLYFGVFGSGQLERVGNVSKLTLGIEEETKELLDYENAGGGTADSSTRISTVTASLSLHNLNAANLATALFGDASALAAGSVTDEEVTAKVGSLIRLAKVAPTSVVVKNEAETITYVSGTDYNVTGAGILIPDTGSAIVDDQVLNVAYSYGAQNIVEAITSTGQEFTMALDGINEADSGKAAIVDLWRVRFSPAQALDLISDEFGVLELEAKLLSDDSQPFGKSKYFRLTFQ